MPVYEFVCKDCGEPFEELVFGGEKVVLNGGIMVIPVLHELMQVRLTTVKLEVSRLNKDALITLDKLRVDVVGLFHIKVKPDAQSIAAAAQTLGNSVNNPDAVSLQMFRRYIASRQSDEEFPGSMGFGVIEHGLRVPFHQGIERCLSAGQVRVIWTEPSMTAHSPCDSPLPNQVTSTGLAPSSRPSSIAFCSAPTAPPIPAETTGAQIIVRIQ